MSHISVGDTLALGKGMARVTAVNGPRVSIRYLRWHEFLFWWAGQQFTKLLRGSEWSRMGAK